MEWWLISGILLASFVVLLLTGMPVAFAFLLINVVGVVVFWGGNVGLRLLILSMWDSVSTFVLMPVVMFILMGEVMFRSGIAPHMIDAVDKWIGRMPGRLGLLAVVGGTLFSTLSGSNMANTAMLGSTLTPELEKRRYKKPMSLGPILGSGGLAMMIPPSNLGVIFAALARLSVLRVLIATVIPGLIMATLYASYVITRCRLQPSIAPPYGVTLPPISDRIMSTLRYVLPLGSIVFLVIGTMLLGWATPSQASAAGALATFVLAFIYRGLNWQIVKKSVGETVKITGMVLLIITSAKVFSQILAFSGVTRGAAELVEGLPLSPVLIIIGMQVIVLLLGMFMDAMSIMMVTLPVYMPIIGIIGINPIWFAAIMLLSIEMSGTTPPFGMNLFVMKGVAPADTTMGDIYRAGLPFLGCDLIAMVLMLAFPPIVLWLPGL